MSEKELSANQTRRVEIIKEQWFRELEELPPLNLGPNQLSHAANKPRLDLEKKYWPRIKAIMEE